MSAPAIQVLKHQNMYCSFVQITTFKEKILGKERWASKKSCMARQPTSKGQQHSSKAPDWQSDHSQIGNAAAADIYTSTDHILWNQRFECVITCYSSKLMRLYGHLCISQEWSSRLLHEYPEPPWLRWKTFVHLQHKKKP